MKQFTILIHNAFWFQGTPFLTDTPPQPDADVLAKLCAMYRQISPNIICLQEVQSRDAFKMVGERLGMCGCYCPGTALPQYGGAVFWHACSGRQIRSSQGAAVTTQRMWQIVEAEAGECCLRIGNAHLPSQRQLGREQAAGQRLVELEDVIRSCGVGPDVIAGDFNEQPAGPVGKCLERHGYIDAAVRSGRADVPTNLGQGRGDYLWIRKCMGDRVLEYGVINKQEMARDGKDKQYLSDHLPLWITVELE